jgi:1,4-dihydroxy-2-naphthoyl-CoA hydrolase
MPSFIYHRTVRFQETDGAGVVFFANVLSLCHEAYEAALIAQGIDLKVFFNHPETVVPIVHATVDFRQPLRVGDGLALHLTPQLLKESEFEISYQILAVATDRVLCTALTRHVCIDPLNRTRKALPPELLAWLLGERLPQKPVP